MFSRVNSVPLETCALRLREQGNSEHLMMDWTRLVSNLLKLIAKKLPRDCMLQGYMFASLNINITIIINVIMISTISITTR